MTRKRLVVAAIGGVLLALFGLIRVQDTHRAPLLPSWLPELRPRPLAGVGEQRLAAHMDYALALGPDYRLYAWGGDGRQGFTPTGESLPVATAIDFGLADWRFVAAGYSASYAITRNGDLLRRSMWVDSSQAADPPAYMPFLPGVRWTKVDTHAGLTVGLADDGTLHFWSEGAFAEGAIYHRGQGHAEIGADGLLTGAVANENAVDFSAFGDSAEADAWMQRRRELFAAERGRPFSMALTRKGWTDFCLGADAIDGKYDVHAIDAAGQLWRLDVYVKNAFRYHLMPSADEHLQISPVRSPVPFQRVYCHGWLRSALALDHRRALWIAGRDDAQPLFPGRRWLAVAVGPFSAGIANDGSLWAWGERYQRAVLGVTGKADAQPILVDDEHEWVEVDNGGPLSLDAQSYGYFIARDARGAIYTWGWSTPRQGSRTHGLLADGGVAEHRDRPQPILMAPAQ